MLDALEIGRYDSHIPTNNGNKAMQDIGVRQMKTIEDLGKFCLHAIDDGYGKSFIYW